MTGLAAGVFLLAAILFYRFVERRHKILLAKTLGAVVILAFLGVALLVYLDKSRTSRERDRLSSVTIVFLRPAADSARNPFLPYRDTVFQATFRLCNKGTLKVTDVGFYPKTFFSGRSTPHELRIPGPGEYYSDNRFQSDFILAPRACTTLTWKGRFQVFDSVAAVPSDVTVEGDQ